MKPLSEHTYLINCIIGLTKRVKDWPSTLRDLGFKLEWISPLLITADGQTVRPDLLLDSNRLLHALTIECKGGRNVDGDQLRRLLDLDVDSILPRVNVYNPRELHFETVYSCMGENASSVVEQISAISDVPVLSFHRDQLKKDHAFEKEELESALSDPIPLPGPAPTSFYPFDEQDDNGIVALYILPEIIKQSIKRAGRDPEELRADELLAGVHPLWKAMDDRARSALEAKVASVLTEFSKRGQLQSVRRVRRGKSWRIVLTLQALREECQKLVDELTKQRQIEEFPYEGKV